MKSSKQTAGTGGRRQEREAVKAFLSRQFSNHESATASTASCRLPLLPAPASCSELLPTVRRRAELGQDALAAEGRARFADCSTVRDEQVREVYPVGFGDEAQQVALDLLGRL